MVNKNTASGVKSNIDGNFHIRRNIVDKNEVNSVVAEEKVKLKAGDTISLELPEYKFVTGVKVNGNVKGTVEYTINGMDWIK